MSKPKNPLVECPECMGQKETPGPHGHERCEFCGGCGFVNESELAAPSPPPPSPTQETFTAAVNMPDSVNMAETPAELKEALIAHERLCMEDLRAAFGSEDASRAIEPVTTRILESRSEILAFVSRLRSQVQRMEADRLEPMHALAILEYMGDKMTPMMQERLRRMGSRLSSDSGTEDTKNG